MQNAGHPRRARASAAATPARPGAGRLRRGDRRTSSRARPRSASASTSTSSSPTTCRATDAGFDVDTNAVTIVGRDGAERCRCRRRRASRREILDRVEKLLLAARRQLGHRIAEADAMDRDSDSTSICDSPASSASPASAAIPRGGARGRRRDVARTDRELAAVASDASCDPRRRAASAFAQSPPRRWPRSATDIGDCTRCKLHTLGRTADRVRRRQSRRRPDVRRRGAGRRRRHPGRCRSSAAPASC